jgi:histone H4
MCAPLGAARSVVIMADKIGAKVHGAERAHRHRATQSMKGRELAAPEIRRLARRGGVKRLTESTNPAVRAALTLYLERIVRDAVIYTEYERRKTVTTEDVLRSLSRNGTPLYDGGAAAAAPAHHRRRRRTTEGAAAAAAASSAADPSTAAAAADTSSEDDEDAKSGSAYEADSDP